MGEMSNDAVLAVSTLFERNIGNGAWTPGMKLPTERELEQQFGVPRNKLRNILKRLEADGKITRHVGRGSFVSGDLSRPAEMASIGLANSPVFVPPRLSTETSASITDLTVRIQGASPHDIMEVRMMVEPAAAELAALRATAADLGLIEQCNEASKAVDGLKEFEYWDGRLHLEIVRAAKNDLLSGIYEAVNSARLQPEWEKMKARSVTPQRRQNYRDHHSELVQALLDRDAKRARQISAEHLAVVRRSFFGD
jgi:DNA-binding FadR family transcriptional regulator